MKVEEFCQKNSLEFIGDINVSGIFVRLNKDNGVFKAVNFYVNQGLAAIQAIYIKVAKPHSKEWNHAYCDTKTKLFHYRDKSKHHQMLSDAEVFFAQGYFAAMSEARKVLVENVFTELYDRLKSQDVYMGGYFGPILCESKIPDSWFWEIMQEVADECFSRQ